MLLGWGGARAEDPAALGKSAVELMATEEASVPAGRLSLSVTDRRSDYVAGEKEGDTRKRLLEQKGSAAEGSFVFGPDGWLKDLTVQLSAAGETAGAATVRTRTAEVQGTFRVLLEATVDGKEQKQARVSRVTDTAPGDAILSRRVARSLAGMQWTSTRAEAGLLTLEGKRGEEKHTLVLRGAPNLQVKSWRLSRVLIGPSGDRYEQTYWCEVTPGSTPGSIGRVEEWIVTSPPAGTVLYRVSEVKKAEAIPPPKPGDLAARFPKGTLVTDSRNEVPVEYEQTEEGVSEEEVAKTAQALAQGRAKPGETAPPFEVKAPGGKTIKLDEYRGKTLVMIWFSSRSRNATASARAVQALSAAYQKKGVAFLGLVGADEGSGEDELEDLRKRLGWSFPIGIDVGGDAMRRYGLVTAVPKVAIVDRAGILVYARPGVNPDSLTTTLDRLVGKS
jgi:peroxiredoxin